MYKISTKDYWALDHLTLGNLEAMMQTEHSMSTASAILALEACVWFLAQNIQFILALIS
jgi:hypothetical protein